MAFNANYPPFNSREGAGPYSGILIDLVDGIAARTGLLFSYEDFPWARAQQMLKADQLDGVCTIATPERRDYMDFTSTPLFREPMVVVFRKGDKRVTSAETTSDLKGLRFGEPLGTGSIREDLREQQVEWVPDLENLLRMLEAGRVDAGLLGRWTAQVRMAKFDKKHKLDMKVIATVSNDDAMRFGLRKSFPGCPEVLATIDKAIQDMESAREVSRIIDKYTR